MKYLGFLSFVIVLGICQSINVTYDCPENLTLSDVTQQCYYFEKDESLTWDEAVMACREMSAYLLKVNDAEENHFIKNEMGCFNSYWIGLNDKAEDKVFEFVDKPYEDVTYTKWWLDEPSHKSPCGEMDEDCVEVNKYSFWNDVSCDKKRNYVCEAETVVVSFTCDEGWFKNENDKEDIIACYKPMESPEKHADAKTSCEQQGGFLFHPTTVAEGLYVNTLASGTSYYWIDIVRNDDGSWPVPYDNWNVYQPTNLSNRKCLVAIRDPYFSYNKAKWSNLNCDYYYYKFNYICKMVP